MLFASGWSSDWKSMVNVERSMNAESTAENKPA